MLVGVLRDLPAFVRVVAGVSFVSGGGHKFKAQDAFGEVLNHAPAVALLVLLLTGRPYGRCRRA